MANLIQEFTWNASDGANGWNQFTRTDATRFNNANTAPVYMGQYGTCRADSTGNTSGLEQSARIGSFTGSARDQCHASFAARVKRVQLSGSNGVPATLNTHRDFLVWSKTKQVDDSTQVTDGGTPVGTPFKLAILKSNAVGAANSGSVFLEFASSNISVIRDPVNGFGFDGLLGHWLGIEWNLRILRGPNNAQSGFRCDARLWNLESRRPRPFMCLTVAAAIGDNVFTPSYFADDILLGANKIRTTTAVDDEFDIDYDEFRGSKAQVGFPRQLYTGEFRTTVVIDKYDPSGAVQDFSRRAIVPPQVIQEVTCNYREHSFETDATVRIADPGCYRIENGAVIAGGGQTATTFATNMSWMTAPQYFTNAKNGNCWLKFKTGALAGQERRCIAWNNSIFYITVEPAFTATPGVGDLFRIEHRSNITKDLLTYPRGDTQYRVEVIGTDHTFRDFTFAPPATWFEVGPVWWSGFIDTVEANEDPARKSIRLRAFGVSEFLKKSRSIYKVSKDGDTLDLFETMKNQFENYDPCIDLSAEAIDGAGAGARLPFECYGEGASDVLSSVSRMLGNFIPGIETIPFKNLIGDLSANTDYRFRLFENRDDRDATNKDNFSLRLLSHTSPRVREITWTKNDDQYGNKWKFEGSSLINSIKTILTHRARRDDSIPKPAGFSSLPFLANTEFDNLAFQGSPSTGSEMYPAAFVGWTVELTDLVSCTGFRDPSTGQFVYGGGTMLRNADLSGKRTRVIYEWNTASTQVDFRTTKNFPGAISSYETLTTTTQALIITLSPNGRPVERFIANSKALTTLGTRLKIIQSTDVVGWLQAGMAAQVDQFSSIRQRYSCHVVEYPLKERPDANNNRISITAPSAVMIRWGKTANGGDGLKVGAKNPLSGTSFGNRSKYMVGSNKLASVRSLSLRLREGGWIAEWTLASSAATAQDVLARFAKAATRRPGR